MNRLSSVRSKARLAWLLLGMFASMACLCVFEGDPYDNLYTRAEPAMEDVAGTYVLTRQTVTSTPLDQLTTQDGERFTESSIVLHEDGTVEAINVPRWVEHGDWDWVLENFASGRGRWAIIEIDDIWSISLAGTELRLDKVIRLGGQAPPYSLIFRGYFPAHESGEAMVYTQEAKPSPPKFTPRALRRMLLRGLDYVSPPLQWALFWFQEFPVPSMVILALGLLAWALRSRPKPP